MTGTATLFLDEHGEPVIVSWLAWESTCELRFVSKMEEYLPDYVCAGPLPTRVVNTLQQKWTRHGLNSLGHVAAEEQEWREVPIVSDATFIT